MSARNAGVDCLRIVVFHAGSLTAVLGDMVEKFQHDHARIRARLESSGSRPHRPAQLPLGPLSKDDGTGGHEPSLVALSGDVEEEPRHGLTAVCAESEGHSQPDLHDRSHRADGQGNPGADHKGGQTAEIHAALDAHRTALFATSGDEHSHLRQERYWAGRIATEAHADAGPQYQTLMAPGTA